MYMWPNSKISVMGGDQAANVLATVAKDNAEKAGTEWTVEAENKIKDPILAKFAKEASPYYATSRLWDDGIIEPKDTRYVMCRGGCVCALHACAACVRCMCALHVSARPLCGWEPLRLEPLWLEPLWLVDIGRSHSVVLLAVVGMFVYPDLFVVLHVAEWYSGSV